MLMDQSSRDDTLVGVGPPGASPAGAVSRQSSRDKRRKRSAGKISMRGEGRAISSGEKYVAAAYGIVFLVLLLWVVIIAAKLTRLEREVGELAERARERRGDG